ncbi:hypothetical protein [Marivirga sp.]|uniref:hypothetical protein n=1 Tax=Marivirga sp. TaxID=2018662 RepID=UPI0025E228FE|nr:hypothetical protein [Marivirga sp.]
MNITLQLSITLIVSFLTITSLNAQDQWNYGLKIGMYNYQMNGNISGRYDDIDVKVHIPYWDIYEPKFPFMGIFVEQPLKILPYFSITYDFSTFERYLFISPQDYNPPSGFLIPQGGAFTTTYQNFTLGILPSIHIKRDLNTRLFAGYEIHYFHHKDETLYASDFSPRWLNNNIRRFEVAKKFVEENPMVPFVHHLAVGAEVKFWRLGLEVKYLLGLNSPLRNVKLNDEFTYPYRTQTNSLYYSLKFYFRKDKD